MPRRSMRSRAAIVRCERTRCDGRDHGVTARRRLMTQRDDLTPDEQELLESRSDPLIDLIGYAERYRPSSPAYDAPRFVRWVARDRREWARDPELLSDAEIGGLRKRSIGTV